MAPNIRPHRVKNPFRLLLFLLVGTVALLALVAFIYRAHPNGVSSNRQQSEELSLEAEEMFQKLTANSWCNKEEMARNRREEFPPTRKNYTFKRDGTYEWSHFSDVPEGNGAGKWNFKKTTQGGGVIFLDSGDVLRFSLNTDNTLSLETIETMVLDQCEPVENQSGAYSSSTLPPVKPSAFFDRIIATKWVKANEFDLLTVPSQVQFFGDGQYTLWYRNGECAEQGFWSLRETHIKRRNFTNNRCDFRDTENSQSYSYDYPIRFSDELLIFENNPYMAEDGSLDTGIIWTDFSGYGGLILKIVYDRPLQSGTAARFNIEIRKPLDDPPGLLLKSFSISQEQFEKTDSGFIAVDDEKILSSINLSSLPLNKGGVYTKTIEVAFEGEGEFGIIFKLDAENKYQPYNFREQYVLSL